jgi:hypothetical protein
MTRMILALVMVLPLAGATPKITYTRQFPGSEPPYFSISVDRAGAMQYRESPSDDHPLSAQLPQTETDAIFALAERLQYFKTALESGLKVANTGKKTLRYEDGGVASEATFNYSLDPAAQELVSRFENIGSTERAYLDLDRTVHFDHLGVNDSLAVIEQLWLDKQLAAPMQFVPLLDRIASHESYMHLVRDRASRLKSEFEAASAPHASATHGSTQKP